MYTRSHANSKNLTCHKLAAYDQPMLGSILIIAFIAGLFMYLLSANAKVVRIGEILLGSSILALLIALAPATVKLLAG